MNSATTGRGLVLALVCLLAASQTHGATRTWWLDGVIFDDGGTASGHIEFDADLASGLNCTAQCPGIIGWEIEVSAGTEGSFVPAVYLPSNSAEAFAMGGPDGYNLSFRQATAGRDRVLVLALESALTDAGGTVELVPGTGFGSRECFDCSPARLISEGALTSVPLLGAAPLLGSAVLGLGVLRGWGRRARRRTPGVIARHHQ